jgi:hypothetical protein
MLTGLDAAGKVAAARIMGKMDAKQQKQFLETMAKLSPESQSALAALMEGTVLPLLIDPTHLDPQYYYLMKR